MSTTTLPTAQHPDFCDIDNCFPEGGTQDYTVHMQSLGNVAGEGSGIQVDLIQIDEQEPRVSVFGETEMTTAQLDELISTLTTARERLSNA